MALKNFYFLNLLLPRKLPDYAENCRFSVQKQCVGIPVLKKVMSHVRKSVTSGIILNVISFL